MYIYICTHIYVCVYIYYIYNLCTHILYMYIYMYIYMCVCIYIYIYILVQRVVIFNACIIVRKVLAEY